MKKVSLKKTLSLERTFEVIKIDLNSSRVLPDSQPRHGVSNS